MIIEKERPEEDELPTTQALINLRERYPSYLKHENDEIRIIQILRNHR